jgi:hypothetical protein
MWPVSSDNTPGLYLVLMYLAVTEAGPSAFANIHENYYYVFVCCSAFFLVIAYFYFP